MNTYAASYGSMNPQLNAQSNLKSSDGDRLDPRGSFENLADDAVVHARLSGDLSQALGTDGGSQVQSDLAHDLSPRIDARLCEPVGAGVTGRIAAGSSHDHTLCELDSIDATCAIANLELRSTSTAGVSYSQSGEEALDLAKHIDSYVPKMNAEDWAVIEEFVRDAVRDAEPDRWSVAAPWMSYVAQHVLWCWKIAGLDLNREVIFEPNTISRYVNERDHIDRKSRGTIRSVLLRVSFRLIGEGEHAWEHQRYANAKGSTPYTPDEMVSIRSYMDSERTTYRRDNMRALVALAGGAGLSPKELLLVEKSDVEVTTEGNLVGVRGLQKRVVPLIAAYDDLMRETLSHTNDGELLVLADRVVRGKSVISDFLHSCTGTGLRPHMQRLRSTWIVSHLNARTPFPILMQAAGLTGMSALNRYLPYVEQHESDDEMQMLRLNGSK